VDILFFYFFSLSLSLSLFFGGGVGGMEYEFHSLVQLAAIPGIEDFHVPYRV
jgi:hypothetical protein